MNNGHEVILTCFFFFNKETIPFLTFIHGINIREQLRV